MNVAKEKLLHPDETESELSDRLNVLPAVIKRIDGQLCFDKEFDNIWAMSAILEKDFELLQLAVSANIKFAKQVEGQRTLKSKDIDTLDKLTNSAMKRAALIAATNNAWEESKEVNITLTF